jgi:hypothetical protein
MKRRYLLGWEKEHTFLQQIMFYVDTNVCSYSLCFKYIQNKANTCQMPSYWLLTEDYISCRVAVKRVILSLYSYKVFQNVHVQRIYRCTVNAVGEIAILVIPFGLSSWETSVIHVACFHIFAQKFWTNVPLLYNYLIIAPPNFTKSGISEFYNRIAIKTWAVLSSGRLHSDRLCGLLVRVPEVQVQLPALPDFLRSSGSATGSTQPREYTRKLNGVICVPEK